MSEFRNRKYAAQLRDFSELRWGNNRPTDIDLGMEFGRKLFIWGEVKYGGAMQPKGQRIYYERLCSLPDSLGIPATVLIARHDEEDGDIPVARLLISEYLWRGQWRTPKNRITVKEAIDRFRDMAGLDA